MALWPLTSVMQQPTPSNESTRQIIKLKRTYSDREGGKHFLVHSSVTEKGSRDQPSCRLSMNAKLRNVMQEEQ